MVFGLPTPGEPNWDVKLDASIEAVKTTADAAAAEIAGRLSESSLTASIGEEAERRIDTAVNALDPEFGTFVAAADHTAILDAAMAKAVAEARPLYIPAGEWNYDGAGWGSAYANVLGAGRSRTTINLGAGKYLFDISGAAFTFHLSDLQTVGGAGVVKQTLADAMVGEFHIVERCVFTDYTGCAIDLNSVDSPFWRIRDCQFDGLDYNATMGVAIGGGGTDNCLIERNSFTTNRVAVKVVGGSTAKVRDNDFVRYATARPTGPAIDVWIVPGATTTSGSGLQIDNNKFGNENLVAGDWRVVIADESAGATNGAKFPNLAADSTGQTNSVSLDNNLLSGISAVAPPLIYTTTPTLRAHIGRLKILATIPSYLIQYRTTAGVTPSSRRGLTVAGPIQSEDAGVILVAPLFSNVAGEGILLDPLTLAHQPGVAAHRSVGDPGGRSELLAAANRPLTTWALTEATLSAVTDSVGGTEAQEVIYSTTSGVIKKSLAAMTVGRPGWIEFDIKDGSTSPLTSLAVQVVDSSGEAYHAARVVRPTPAWSRVRIPFTPRAAGTTPQIWLATSAVGRVQIGRVRVYHAHEAQAHNVVLESPNGTRYRIDVSDAGAISATAI